MLFRRITAITILFAIASPSVAWAHGTERHFGTVINGRGGPIPSFDSGGSPAFTLMLIDSSSHALRSAAEEAQTDVVRKLTYLSLRNTPYQPYRCKRKKL